MLDQMRIILNNKNEIIFMFFNNLKVKTQKAPYSKNRENNRSWQATRQEF